MDTGLVGPTAASITSALFGVWCLLFNPRLKKCNCIGVAAIDDRAVTVAAVRICFLCQLRLGGNWAEYIFM